MQRALGDVFERDTKLSRGGGELYLAEELVSSSGAATSRFLEEHLGAKGVVEPVGAKAARMDWPGDKLVKWEEVLVLRSIRVVVVCGAVVDIGGKPDDILDLAALQR